MRTNNIKRLVVGGVLAVSFLAAGCGATSHRTAGPLAVLPSEPTVSDQVTTTTRSVPATAPSTSTSTTSSPAPTTTRATSTSSVPPTTAGSDGSGCTNLAVNDSVRAALAQANDVPNGETSPGTVYFGECDGEQYAVAQFVPLPGDTDDQKVPFQDDGTAQRFFTMASGGGWTLTAVEPYFQTQSCAGFTQAPAALRQIWRNCPSSY